MHVNARQSMSVHANARQSTPVHANARKCTQGHASARQCTPEHDRVQQITSEHLKLLYYLFLLLKPFFNYRMCNVQYTILSLLDQKIYRAIHEQKVFKKRTSQHLNFLKLFKLFEFFCRVVKFYCQALEFCIAEHASTRESTPKHARARQCTPKHAIARQSTPEHASAR
jgi:hypothetical protein